MKVKFVILYSWFIRSLTFFLPEIPVIQRFRGWLYSLGMNKCGSRFRVSFNVVLNHLEMMNVENNVYLACGCVVTGAGELQIGSHVLIGPNVVLATSKHIFNGSNFLGGYMHGKIIIGEGCWIGANSTLLPGTHVRASSVIGAGSVCNQDFGRSKVLIAGMPAKIVKNLTEV